MIEQLNKKSAVTIIWSIFFVFIFILAYFWHLGYLNFYKNTSFLNRAYGGFNGLNYDNNLNNYFSETILENNFYLNNKPKINNFDFNWALSNADIWKNNLGGPQENKYPSKEASLDLKKDLNSSIFNFILPVLGINWGKLHSKNAVDIAAACNLDVVASAEGLIIDLKDGGWNNGYGKYIKIEHPNQTKTVYAHLNKINISLGDYVGQGQKIGEVGETGEATGCHLHFEVLGAKNPFVK